MRLGNLLRECIGVLVYNLQRSPLSHYSYEEETRHISNRADTLLRKLGYSGSFGDAALKVIKDKFMELAKSSVEGVLQGMQLSSETKNTASVKFVSRKRQRDPEPSFVVNVPSRSVSRRSSPNKKKHGRRSARSENLRIRFSADRRKIFRL